MKIPIIPQLFYKNCFITYFKEKVTFFSKQCSLIRNNSSLPADVNYITDKHLYLPLHFQPKVLEKIIQNLDSNKAHGHDNTGILKICVDSICVPLEMIFKIDLLTGKFHCEWKNEPIVPIHKKSDK